MRIARLLLLLSCITICTLPAARAIPVSARSATTLTEASDTIVIGTFHVRSEDQMQSGTAVLDPETGARRYVASVSPSLVLKGPSTQEPHRVSYLVTEELSQYARVTDGTQGMFFLVKQNGDQYAFTNPTYPFLPATLRMATPPSGSALDQVTHVEAEVLNSPQESVQAKRSAALSLGTVHTTYALDELKRVLPSLSSNVRLEAIGVLLSLGDTSEVDTATNALLTQSSDQDTAVLHNLRVGIRDGVKTPDALPQLSKLVQSGDAETRRAAMQALRHINLPASEALFSAGLRDPDQGVRYNAVLGLSEMSGGRNMHPNPMEFHKHEDHYTTYWMAHTAQPKQ